jgi:hypothetical protein
LPLLIQKSEERREVFRIVAFRFRPVQLIKRLNRSAGSQDSFHRSPPFFVTAFSFSHASHL